MICDSYRLTYRRIQDNTMTKPDVLAKTGLYKLYLLKPAVSDQFLVPTNTKKVE